MQVKALLVAVFLLIFVGCATSEPRVPQISIKSTMPVFITQSKEHNATEANATKSAFVKFKNSSGYENTLEQSVLKKLATLGYVPTTQIQNAKLVVLGDFLSLERFERKSPRMRMFMSMGYGWGRRWHGPGYGFGFGMPLFYDDLDDDFVTTDYYIYKGIVSVLLRVNGDEQRTNLEVQTERNLYSPSAIMPYIEEKIASQILNFFY